MNKKYGILLALVFVALYFVGGGLFFSTGRPVAGCRVAIFAPALHPSMEDIIKGFKTVLSKPDKLCTFTDYNANGNPTLLRGQADEIAHGGYDLIFTVGATCTHTMFELTKKQKSNTPIVFAAVDDPVKMGVVHSLQHPGTNVTGVLSKSQYADQVAALLQVKPTTKNVLLVYNPAGGVAFERDKQELTELFVAHNIMLCAVEVDQAHEISQKVSSHLAGADVVMVLTDHTVVTGIESLVNLCSRYGVTLYTSELNSGHKGAALSFGVQESDYGVLAAELVIKILQDYQRTADISCVMVGKNYLQINTKTMRKQGLDLDQEALNAIKEQGGIIL